MKEINTKLQTKFILVKNNLKWVTLDLKMVKLLKSKGFKIEQSKLSELI